MAHLTATDALGNGDRDGRLVHIQSDERDAAHQARPPCLRLGAGQSGATLDRSMPGAGRPSQPRTSGLATAYLATDAARLITGQTIYVDGGYHIID